MAANTKIISMLADVLRIQYDKKRMIAYGEFQGFTLLVTGTAVKSRAAIDISLCAGKDQASIDVGMFVGSTIPEDISYNVHGYRLNLTVLNKGNVKKIVDRATDTVISVVNMLTGAGYVNYDEMGMEGPSNAYFARGKYLLMNESSAGQMSFEAKKDLDTEIQTEERLIPGIIGALIGSLGGVVLMVLIGRLGRVSMLSGLVMGIGVIFGYKKLGKKFSTLSSIICVVIAVGMSYVGFKIDNGLDLYLELKDYLEGSFMDFVLYGKSIYEMVGELGTYYANMVLMLLTGAGGAIASIFAERQNQKDSYKIEKLG